MKSVIILRHAKADASSSDGQDITRPLTDRGRKDAGLIGKVLRKLDLVPDIILASPSVRTRQTVEYLLDKLRQDVPVTFVDEIYDAHVETLAELIGRQESGERILLVGHNPGAEDLIGRWVNGAGQSPVSLPTAGVARIEWDLDQWSETLQLPGKLVWLADPNSLRDL